MQTGNTKVTSDMLEALPYLRSVVLEALRMSPPAPASRRIAVREVNICGQVIPRGTEVHNNWWVTNRLGWQSPEVFDPERWLHSSGENRQDGSSGSYGFSAFSYGPRACIGQTFARLELLAVVAALTGRFEMEIEDKQKPRCIFGIMASPVKPIKLRMRPLQGW